MPARTDGIICRECGGSGCQLCNHTGWTKMSHLTQPTDKQHIDFADLPIVPMPYGKILPDLTDCYYVNEPEWDEYLGPILCPNCGSDHVVGLSNEHNPEISEEDLSPGSRWFCISCQDSWCYEREI